MIISIVIPTYKNDKSLLKCVQKITEIGTSLKVNYEIIVVDNFLTNEYVDKLSIFKNSNLTILKNPVLGAHHSRRLGLYNSKGDIIIFVDDDNYLIAEYISFIISKVESKNSNDFFIGCATKEFVQVDWVNNSYSPLTYACGSLVGTNFKNNVPIYWGAGMAMNRELGFKIFQKELIVEGRMAKKNYIMSGEDHEYSLRAYFNKADFFYYSEVGLYHDFDVDRLNDDYYQKVQIGFVFAAYILKIYYDLQSSKKIHSNYYSWYLYNLMFTIGYNLKHPLKLQSSLLFKDAINFAKLKNRYVLVNSIV
jgi:glycosyltransferase involved in cell wall biosynthesis